ncbi:unnamed protein product, partial [Mesorhabditis belari]|uniref:Uncharacterized protein n=1 Tax=Mesorhabditis belari TaxID=2138241 RepID=A0AAF3FND4_9BILA
MKAPPHLKENAVCWTLIPRSPNVGISRTPITVNCTPKAGTDENSQGTPTNKAKTMQQQLFMKKKPDLLFSESDFQNSDNCEASKWTNAWMGRRGSFEANGATSPRHSQVTEPP